MSGIDFERDLMKGFKERETECKKARTAYGSWFIFLNRFEGGLFALIIILAAFGLVVIYQSPQVIEQVQSFDVLLCSLPAIIAFVVYLIQDMEISQAECSRMIDEYTLLEHEYARAQHLPPDELACKSDELEERLSIVKFWIGLKPPARMAESKPDACPTVYLPAYS